MAEENKYRAAWDAMPCAKAEAESNKAKPDDSNGRVINLEA